MQDADGEMPTERDRELVPKVVGAAGAITHDELSRGVWLHAKRREVAHQYPSADFRAWLCLASLQFDEQYDSVASLARVLASAGLGMEQAARKGLAGFADAKTTADEQVDAAGVEARAWGDAAWGYQEGEPRQEGEEPTDRSRAQH